MKQSMKRPKIRKRDRIFWVFLSYLWKDWQDVLIVVKPETVICWHKKGFKLFWRYKSRKRGPGRSPVNPEIRKIIFVCAIICHKRRNIIHFNVTMNPTIEWTAQQLVEACSWNIAPDYLLRDRDKIYGGFFQKRIKHMGIKEIITAPQSPWQSICRKTHWKYPKRLPRSCYRIKY